MADEAAVRRAVVVVAFFEVVCLAVGNRLGEVVRASSAASNGSPLAAGRRSERVLLRPVVEDIAGGTVWRSLFWSGGSPRALLTSRKSVFCRWLTCATISTLDLQ